MSKQLRHVIGQTFFVGISGKSLTEVESKFISENNVGGVILFDRNISDPEQLYGLCQSIQKLRLQQVDQQPLFIGIDMEGGRVHRLKAPFTQWPPMKLLGDLDSPSFGFKIAESMGAELLSVGINVDFAPCIDVLTNPKNQVIGDRAFSTDPEMVAKIGSAMARGFIKSGIIPCGKHFPGHGNTLLDSHLDLPIEDKTYEELMETELPPFKRTFRARLDLLMTAHILYPKIDPEWPATLSEKIIMDIARKDLGYRGIVMSDDLEMKALAAKWPQEVIAPRAYQAGCNILLYCHDISVPMIGLEAVLKAVEAGTLDKKLIEDSYERVIQLKKARLSKLVTPPFEDSKRIIGHPDHLSLAKALKNGELPDDLQT